MVLKNESVSLESIDHGPDNTRRVTFYVRRPGKDGILKPKENMLAENFKVKPAFGQSRSRPQRAVCNCLMLKINCRQRRGYPIQTDPNLGPECQEGEPLVNRRNAYSGDCNINSVFYFFLMKTQTKLTFCVWRSSTICDQSSSIVHADKAD